MKFWTVTRKLHDLHEGSRESIKKDIFFPWACSRHTPKVITASRKLLLILPTDTSFFLFLLSFFSFWHRALYIRKDSCIQTRSQMIDDIPSEKKDKLLYFMNIQVEGLSLSRACYNFSLEHTTVRWEKQHFLRDLEWTWSTRGLTWPSHCILTTATTKIVFRNCSPTTLQATYAIRSCWIGQKAVWWLH